MSDRRYPWLVGQRLVSRAFVLLIRICLHWELSYLLQIDNTARETDGDGAGVFDITDGWGWESAGWCGEVMVGMLTL